MKMLLLIAAVVAGGWYWFIGGRQISEADVQAHYNQSLTWMDDMNQKAFCDALDEKYSGKSVSITAAGRLEETTDEKTACESTEKLFATVKMMNEKVGGGIVTNYAVDILSTEISADKKTATVKEKSVLKIGRENQLMLKFSTQSTETFVKRNGKLLSLSSDAQIVVE